MKSREEILKRLRKLRSRYLRQHLRLSQDRLPANCSYNHEISVGPALSGPARDTGARPVAPARASLVVLQDAGPTTVCLYGCEDPAAWAGELCYTREKAASCGWFKPKVDPSKAEREFDALMADDAYVYENYPDVAALQWVVDDRIHRHGPGLFERLLRWLFRSRSKVPPQLPPQELPRLPSDPGETDAPARDVDEDVLENPDFDPGLTNLFR